MAQGPYTSDHCAIIITLNVKKHNPWSAPQMVRHIHKVQPDKWLQEFQPSNVQLSDKLEDMVQTLTANFIRTLDKLAPLRRCKAILRNKQLWYDISTKWLKYRVRKLERKWCKYKLKSTWMAYKSSRNSYYSILNTKKKNIIKDKIQDCGKDSGKLHYLVSNLTSKKEPWSQHQGRISWGICFILSERNLKNKRNVYWSGSI